jgi:hypothetical protein
MVSQVFKPCNKSQFLTLLIVTLTLTFFNVVPSEGDGDTIFLRHLE